MHLDGSGSSSVSTADETPAHRHIAAAAQSAAGLEAGSAHASRAIKVDLVFLLAQSYRSWRPLSGMHTRAVLCPDTSTTLSTPAEPDCPRDVSDKTGP